MEICGMASLVKFYNKVWMWIASMFEGNSKGSYKVGMESIKNSL
jgi:hypothetical protein